MSAGARDQGGGQRRGREAALVNERAKRRQRMVLLSFCALAVAVAVGLAALSLPPLPAAGDGGEQADPLISIPAEQIGAEELWRTDAEREIEDLRGSWERLSGELGALQGQLERMRQSVAERQAAEQEAEFERELLEMISREPQPVQGSSLHASSEVVPPAPPQPISLVRIGGGGPQPPAALAVPGLNAPPIAGPTAPDDGQAAGLPPGGAPGAEARPAEESAQADSYLPSGSFMPAVILGGLDAPTGVVSRDNPHPVLLRVAAHARLPNLARLDLRECFVLAAGYGDISSERALLRTERLSCRRRDGTFVDAQLRGFVVGEDGRAGVRGRLVTKQGQLLQRSLIAGIGAGMSEVFRSRQATHIRAASLDGTGGASDALVQSSTIDNFALGGLSAGLHSSLDRLANYYIALAERIHPVIEVGAGRTVDIVVQEGLELGS